MYVLKLNLLDPKLLEAREKIFKKIYGDEMIGVPAQVDKNDFYRGIQVLLRVDRLLVESKEILRGPFLLYRAEMLAEDDMDDEAAEDLFVVGYF